MFQIFKRPSRPTLRDLITAQGKLLMAVSAQVQTVLDKVTATQSIVASVEQGLTAQGALISQLNQTIAALQAQAGAGQALGADDIAALATIGQDLDGINTGLSAAIPANTNTGGTTTAPTADTAKS